MLLGHMTLWLVAGVGHLDVVKYLLDHGADIHHGMGHRVFHMGSKVLDI